MTAIAPPTPLLALLIVYLLGLAGLSCCSPNDEVQRLSPTKVAL